MGSKVIRNVRKILKTATSVLLGRVTSGTGPGEELTPTQVRTLLNVYTTTQTDTAISTAVNSLVAGAPGLLDTLDELSAALGDDANFASTVTTALAGKVDSSTLSESIDDRVAALLVAGTNITITYNDAAGTLTVASTAGGLSGTGSVDNAALRADGTGGATLQNSAWIINDNLTASPNNTVNHACIEATGGTTNVSVSIKPKGSGAFCLSAPDGTATGGNVRGDNAIDLQTSRSAATHVASGSAAVVVGTNNTASGAQATAVGRGNLAGNTGSSAVGWGNSANASFGTRASCFGYGNTSNVPRGVAMGHGNTSSGNYGSAVGYSNTASGFYSSAVGRNNTSSSSYSSAFGNLCVASAAKASAFGYRAKTSVANTAEVGYWSNATTRGAAVRVHGTTGMSSMSIQNRATAYTDGGATAGAEADNTLAREMFSMRRNGDALLVDVNIGGTVKTLSLGTAT